MYAILRPNWEKFRLWTLVWKHVMPNNLLVKCLIIPTYSKYAHAVCIDSDNDDWYKQQNHCPELSY